MATAMQTLSKFRQIAESHGVDEIIASATSAVREADNGGDFLTAARRSVGLQIRVISGTEEARLIHLAAAYAVNVGRRASVVIDIGGGSTEITLGTSARVEMARSFKLGAIRLTERFGTNDPLTPDDATRLVRHVRRECAAYLRQIVARGYQRVIGASGTILSLGALAAGRRRPVDEVRNLRVATKDLRRLRDRLVRMPLAARLKIPGLDPRRADLAPVGILLLDTILDALAAEDITLCDFALREGLVLDYIHRNRAHIRKAERYPDVRRRSVIELAERCSYAQPHASQVARLALAIFDATVELHGLGSREREWLDFGALLHDIGHHISYEGHHRHSYYLIKHGDLRGFDPEETEIIALVARHHRRGTPKKSHEGFKLLPKKRREVVRLLAAIVRLAEGLDRSHTQSVTDLKITLGDTELAIGLKTRGDAELELWAANRHAAPLGELFQKPIEFSLTPRGPRRAVPAHAEHARHSPQLPRTPLRGRGHRRVGQDDAAGAARQVAQRQRPSRVRH